jgi:hypothetical protein
MGGKEEKNSDLERQEADGEHGFKMINKKELTGKTKLNGHEKH